MLKIGLETLVATIVGAGIGASYSNPVRTERNYSSITDHFGQIKQNINCTLKGPSKHLH